MKACSYCGRENADTAAFCMECGTTFEVEIPHKQEIARLPLAKRFHELNAWSATAILLVYLIAQVVCAIVVGLIAALRVNEGAHPLDRFTTALDISIPVTSTLMPVFSGIATILTARILVRRYLTDTTATGAAWVRGHWRNTGKGVVVGLFIAGCVYTMSMFLFESPLPFRQLSRFENVAAQPGLSQVLYGVTVIILAPFSEEILFRGVLYGGYRKSFGAFGAALLTTGLFCLLHLKQMVHYPPVLLGLVTGSLGALALRLSSGAVGPAIGVHVGYNTWLFSLALFRQYAG